MLGVAEGELEERVVRGRHVREPCGPRGRRGDGGSDAADAFADVLAVRTRRLRARYCPMRNSTPRVNEIPADAPGSLSATCRNTDSRTSAGLFGIERTRLWPAAGI